MGEVGCLLVWVALLVGFMVGSVLIADTYGMVNKIRGTSCFGLQVIIVESIYFSIS